MTPDTLPGYDDWKTETPEDEPLNALRVVEISTGQPLKPIEKNAAAVALGRLGGLKGGKGRAAKLSDDRRHEIAQQAAKARWAKAKGLDTEYGNNKLVYPASAAIGTPKATPKVEDDGREIDQEEKGKKGGGGNGNGQHPLIEGLLEELPKPKTEWPMEERKNWLEMASTIFNVIYKNSDDNRGSLRVVVEKVSAK
jgi:hypothetical protein